jgi:hypothetical protein
MTLLLLVLLIIKCIAEILSDFAVWPGTTSLSLSLNFPVFLRAQEESSGRKRRVRNYRDEGRTVTQKGRFSGPIFLRTFFVVLCVEQNLRFLPDL